MDTTTPRAPIDTASLDALPTPRGLGGLTDLVEVKHRYDYGAWAELRLAGDRTWFDLAPEERDRLLAGLVFAKRIVPFVAHPSFGNVALDPETREEIDLDLNEVPHYATETDEPITSAVCEGVQATNADGSPAFWLALIPASSSTAEGMIAVRDAMHRRLFSRRQGFIRFLTRRIRGRISPLFNWPEIYFHLTPEDVAISALAAVGLDLPGLFD